MKTLRFIARAACAIPHPEKASRGGEDGFFITPDGRVLGVADGVGGWADAGVNPAFFTWMFMKRCFHYSQTGAPKPMPLRDVLQLAWQDTVRAKLQGSCTAAVVAFDDFSGYDFHPADETSGLPANLVVSHIGDCGVIIIRNGGVILRTKERQYKFNFPHQIGSDGTQSPNKLAGTAFLTVQPDDVVVLGSDGVFDNVFDADLVTMVNDAVKTAEKASVKLTGMARIDCQKLADTIANAAATRGADESYMSPFSVGAIKAGYRYLGGKQDDVCVVVGVVGDASEMHKAMPVPYTDVEAYFKWAKKPCAAMPSVKLDNKL